jgi:hypothetical protein
MKLLKIKEDRYILTLNKMEVVRVAYAFLRGDMG